jgi:hypothetical protein
MMNKKEEIKLKILNLQNQLFKLEEKEASELSSKLVGKYFKVRNCYSLPEKPSDYWWLYAKIDHADGSLVCLTTFQIDKDGRIEVEQEKIRHNSLVNRYTEISKAEYTKALKKLKDKIIKVKP